MEQAKNTFTILHFNDVYDLEERKIEPVGGAARFKTALDSFSHLEPMILFSGDLFEPSLCLSEYCNFLNLIVSTAYDGEQMIKPMNDFGVQVATFGNHEFSLELDMLTSYIKRANFPWLLSNVKSTVDNKPLAAGIEWHTMHKNGLKFGFMGIAEEGWARHIRTISQSLIVYEDFIDCARRLNTFLREEEKCDFVIALTHMGTTNDTKLAKEFDGLDLILGGHDHLNMAENVNGTYIIKSGSDFCEFNNITLKMLDPACLDKLSAEDKQRIYKGRYLVDIEPVEITTKFEPDPEVKAHIDECLRELNEKLKLPLFNAEVHLETRTKMVRSSEQNFPNLLTDIVRLYSGTDVAVLNTGTFRGNVCFKPGVFTLRDVNIVLPWKDEIYTCELTGEQLWKMLENSVVAMPAQNAGFLSVSGIKFAFDIAREPQNRIEVSSIKISGNPLNLTALYTLATNHFMIQGDYGYQMLREARMLHDKDDAEDIHTVLKKIAMLARDSHILEEHSRNVAGDSQKPVLPDSLNSPKKIAENHMMNLYYKMKPIIKDFINIEGEWMISVAPSIEGRTVKL